MPESDSAQPKRQHITSKTEVLKRKQNICLADKMAFGLLHAKQAQKIKNTLLSKKRAKKVVFSDKM